MGRTVMDEGRELAVVDALPPERRHTPQIGILRPLVDADEARRAIAQYEELKSAIMRDSDKQWYTQSVKQPDGHWADEKKFFLKKSYWRRIANFFGISLQQVSEEFITGDEVRGTFGYSVMYRAIGPNGLSMESDGMCWNDEKLTTDRKTGELKGRLLSRHDTRATAHTRAKNRAISDLVAGGEVSAEEINDREPENDEREPESQQRKTTAAAAKPSPTRERLEAMQRRLIALDANYADPQQFKLWTLDVLGMTEQQLRARALNSGELVALENYLLDMEQAAAGTAFPPEKTPGELAREQAQQPAQPAATPDLADLPMARGGRH